MIVNFKPIVLFISILVFLGINMYAQTDCALILKQAEKSFDDGNIEKVPELLNECLKKGFSKNEKIRAYRIIIISYLFEDKKNLAEDVMLDLLKLDPEYEVNNIIDPAEYIKLFNSYRTLPIYSIGFFGGINFSNIQVSELYGVHNINNASYDYKSSGVGFQFGIKINRYLFEGFEMNLDISYIQNSFEYTDSVFNFAYVNFHEKQSRIDFPLSLSYEIGKKRIKPYLKAGIYGSYILGASSSAVRSYTEGDRKEISGSTIPLKDYRKSLNMGGTFGLGIKYKIPRGYLFFEGRYNIGLFNQVNADNRYSNPELIYKYFYLDNDFTLSNMQFSIGYMYSIYKPQKK